MFTSLLCRQTNLFKQSIDETELVVVADNQGGGSSTAVVWCSWKQCVDLIIGYGKSKFCSLQNILFFNCSWSFLVVFLQLKKYFQKWCNLEGGGTEGQKEIIKW